MASAKQIKFAELPEAIRVHVNPDIPAGSTTTQPPVMISEYDYYNAFERMLCTKRAIGTSTSNTTTVELDQAVIHRLDATTQEQLIQFHVTTVMQGGWLSDHSSHRQYSYFPSNTLPLGSQMEWYFFMRDWARNANYRQGRRLYARQGTFETIIGKDTSDDTCPCHFLLYFYVYNRDTWVNPTTNRHVYRFAVENELLFRSDFFNKTNPPYVHFNRWLSESLLDRLTIPVTDGFAVCTVGQRIKVSNDWNKHLLYGVPRTSTRRNNDYLVERKLHRVENLKPLLNRLYFRSDDNEGSDVDGIHLLTRCEDHRSYLYSPKLKNTACLHLDETVRYVQTRCGDEISTEIRTCKACGLVRATSN